MWVKEKCSIVVLFFFPQHFTVHQICTKWIERPVNISKDCWCSWGGGSFAFLVCSYLYICIYVWCLYCLFPHCYLCSRFFLPGRFLWVKTFVWKWKYRTQIDSELCSYCPRLVCYDYVEPQSNRNGYKQI